MRSWLQSAFLLFVYAYICTEFSFCYIYRVALYPRYEKKWSVDWSSSHREQVSVSQSFRNSSHTCNREKKAYICRKLGLFSLEGGLCACIWRATIMWDRHLVPVVVMSQLCLGSFGIVCKYDAALSTPPASVEVTDVGRCRRLFLFTSRYIQK